MKVALLTSGGIAPCLSASIGRLVENYFKNILT
jgi:6-phosphofructokinase